MHDPVVGLSEALADRYIIDRDIGHGATATVYLAQDVKHARSVAIKVLAPELALAVRTERFLREIQIAARLQHPHILPLHDSGQAGGLLLLRHALRSWGNAPGPSRPRRTVAARGRCSDHARSRERLELRPRARCGAPGHQARQHPAVGRRGSRGGFRDRACHRGRGNRGRHRDRRLARHASVHESRASRR